MSMCAECIFIIRGPPVQGVSSFCPVLAKATRRLAISFYFRSPLRWSSMQFHTHMLFRCANALVEKTVLRDTIDGPDVAKNQHTHTHTHTALVHTQKPTYTLPHAYLHARTDTHTYGLKHTYKDVMTIMHKSHVNSQMIICLSGEFWSLLLLLLLLLTLSSLS